MTDWGLDHAMRSRCHFLKGFVSEEKKTCVWRDQVVVGLYFLYYFQRHSKARYKRKDTTDGGSTSDIFVSARASTRGGGGTGDEGFSTVALRKDRRSIEPGKTKRGTNNKTNHSQQESKPFHRRDRSTSPNKIDNRREVKTQKEPRHKRTKRFFTSFYFAQPVRLLIYGTRPVQLQNSKGNKGGGGGRTTSPARLDESHEHVRGERPLVRLVEHDALVLGQVRVVHGLTEQHTVRHEAGTEKDNRRSPKRRGKQQTANRKKQQDKSVAISATDE